MPRKATQSTDVATTPEREVRHFTDEEIAKIREAGFDSVASHATSFEEFTQSYPVIRDKRELIAVPFISLEWNFNEGDNGEFVSAVIMRRDNSLAVINDGGSGIYRQYKELTERIGRQLGPITHKGGLSTSEYWFNSDTGAISRKQPNDGGDWRKATTFYLT
ncbi:hypothetical protein SAZ_11565 [Streptomyces noursei ZPM]|uniref:Uncharacterized protein n=2 Tax=Streptomyces TaxID=1883 RepID=A0A4Q9HQG9_STRKA|nr:MULTISPECIES: hypothetical protein [Streptomyces]AKA08636.1 hypothetical protein SAZ_11565 [Streptomyces noursei ZPM]EOT00683.1 hypothetical protein K530_27604 [Streptomyces noursei CCRC 11814]EXU89975.1 hypothetical protein P354_19365 [Streptomyces noursei PD-1]TBO57178.1 hypothetical protein EYS09_24065 [Streptomyces kasugaensis]UWS71500.1 hypothetical protein N1H47_09755 [Streptomyces noursei]